MYKKSALPFGKTLSHHSLSAVQLFGLCLPSPSIGAPAKRRRSDIGGVEGRGCPLALLRAPRCWNSSQTAVAATRVTVPCGVLPLPRVEERTYMKQTSCLRAESASPIRISLQYQYSMHFRRFTVSLLSTFPQPPEYGCRHTPWHRNRGRVKIGNVPACAGGAFPFLPLSLISSPSAEQIPASPAA